MESWQKWSFPFRPPGQDRGDPAGWRSVRKRRRISRFSLVNGQIVTQVPRPGQHPRCEVELTEVRTRGQDWWTLGFEATGPADLLHGVEPPAALVLHGFPLYAATPAAILDVTAGVLGDHRGVEVARYLDRSSAGLLTGRPTWPAEEFRSRQ
jgi:hypothetical protein